jgi:hypothetical protein
MYSMPALELGDLVFWHDDPLNPSPPSVGWVLQLGRSTISILVFSENAGFVEKKSVRHKDDPFWRESEMAGNWAQWGCWTAHPTTETLKEIKALLTKMKMDSARAPAAAALPVIDHARRGPGRPPKAEVTESEVTA